MACDHERVDGGVIGGSVCLVVVSTVGRIDGELLR